MSTMIGGPGWWLASDGRWYPPETHPDYRRRTQEMWTAPAEAPAQPSAPLEMTAPGPIPPAFTLSNGPLDPAAQIGRTIMVEPARYLGGFAPEPETQDSSFLRCTEAGLQFRTRRGVAWVPWNDVSGMEVEGPAEMSRRFRVSPQLAPGLFGFSGRREGIAFVVALSGASEIVFEVGGTTPDELRQAMRPVLDRFRVEPAADLAAPDVAGSEVAGSEVAGSEVAGSEAEPRHRAGGEEASTAIEATTAGANDAVQRLLASASAQGLLEPLHAAADGDSLRSASDALDAARSAAGAARAAAAAAERAAEAVRRFTVVRASEAEIDQLLTRCKEFVQNAIADAERQAHEILSAANAEAGTILTDASRRAGELAMPTSPPVGPPPVISPESARELNSTIDGYIKVNNELMHELRLLSGSFGQEHEVPVLPADQTPEPSYPSS